MDSSRKINEIPKSVLSRILVTGGLIFLIRLGSSIPLPGLDKNVLKAIVDSNSPIRSFVVNFSASNSYLGLFLLGISPYINASIVLQLFITTNPELKRIQKEEGQAGREKIFRYTRYLTLFWALVQSVGIAFFLRSFLFDSSIKNLFEIVLVLTTGAMIVLWISEVITKYGISNGSSLLVFFNIIGNSPRQFSSFFSNLGVIDIILFPSALLLSLWGVVILQEAFRYVEIVSSKELVGGFESNLACEKRYIPFRFNQGGVMPLVFASYFLPLVNYLFKFIENKITLSDSNLLNSFLPDYIGQIAYFIVEFCLICFFNYCYSTLIFDPNDVAEDLRKRASFIPGIRPGKQTFEYLDKLSKRLALFGGLILATINLMLNIVNLIVKLPITPGIISSQIIIVGVTIEIVQKIRTILISDSYKQF